MKNIVFILLSFCLAGEMEVDGDLKVTGTVDASGNPITNVGAALFMTDAINGNVLQSALRDDGVYEYKYYYVAIATNPFYMYNYIVNSMEHISKYTSLDYSDEGEDWQAKINLLSADGWKIIFQNITDSYSYVFGTQTGNYDYYGYVMIVTLSRPLIDD